VPVAIIGTFFCKYLVSINMLTLFAMILAIIVVDDAIVVVEAVHAKLDEGAVSQRSYSFCNERNLGSNYLDYTCNVSGIYSCIFLSGPAGSLPTVCSNFGHCYFRPLTH
jgi:HAE1 family hydrophobic/amphiphilic exporter-1